MLPGLQALAGYTHIDIENADGSRAKRETPRHLLKLASTYRLPTLQQMRIGASYCWQDDIRSASGEQDSYSVLGLMADYAFTQNLSATLNLNNVTDGKYLNSLKFGQSYCGAPRNAMLKLSWKY